LQGGDAHANQECTLHIGEHLSTAIIRCGICNDAIHDRPSPLSLSDSLTFFQFFSHGGFKVAFIQSTGKAGKAQARFLRMIAAIPILMIK
jgi:hypothetical protein